MSGQQHIWERTRAHFPVWPNETWQRMSWHPHSAKDLTSVGCEACFRVPFSPLSTSFSQTWNSYFTTNCKKLRQHASTNPLCSLWNHYFVPTSVIPRYLHTNTYSQKHTLHISKTSSRWVNGKLNSNRKQKVCVLKRLSKFLMESVGPFLHTFNHHGFYWILSTLTKFLLLSRKS